METTIITLDMLKEKYPPEEVDKASWQSACGCNLCTYLILKNKFGDRLPPDKLYVG